MSALRSILRRWLWLSFIGLAGLLGLSAVARFHWVAELTTHFTVYWVLASVVVAGIAASIGARRLALAAGALAILHSVHVWPYLPTAALPGLPGAWGAAEAHAAGGAEAPRARLRVLSVNVFSGNRNHYAVEALIREQKPDLVALLEITDRWLMGLADLEADYPYRAALPQHDNFGIALFSRHPIEDLEITPLVREGLPMVRGRIVVGGTAVHLFAVHPVPPSGGYLSMLRDLQLEQVASLVRDRTSGEAIVMGDLNTTPWSPIHRELEETTGLRNAARGHGIINTWPTAFAPLMIPIDHVLVSPGLRVRSIGTLDTNGSDHLGLMVDLELQSRTAQTAEAPRPRGRVIPR